MMARVRKRIDRLTAKEEDELRAAFRALMRSPDPKANYTYWVDIHDHCCPHGTELFLPWHRAYLFAFEDALRRVAGAPDVTLPFWDWTVIREIPPLVTREPLTSQRNDADPDELPSGPRIERIVNEPRFYRFGGDPRTGGNLENAHGEVHTWVGFVMTTGRAPQDPLFWFHHSYVDRLWHDWQRRFNGGPTDPKAELQGIPGGWTVRDVDDIAGQRLGYEYEDVERFLGTFTFGHDRATVRLGKSTRRIGGSPRVRLDDVSLVGHGDPPVALEVRVADGPDGLLAVVSLFGLHGHHHGTAHVASSKCKHQRGAFAAPLTPAPVAFDVNEEFTITARWDPNARQRAGLAIGAISIGDV